MTYEFPELATVLDLDVGLPTLAGDLERPVLHVALDLGVIELATNETLGVEDGVLRVGVERVLRAVTNTACHKDQYVACMGLVIALTVVPRPRS